MEELSTKDVQKIVLHSQRIPPVASTGSALSATLSAMEHLGYVQIDTISVVQRAHHHTLWNRNPRYTPSHLNQLVENGQVFEYWAHAAAFLPMRDYRFTLPRKEAIASGKQSHWYVRDSKLIDAVRERIKVEGPLMAKDFNDKRKTSGGWGAKPTKMALESLFMMGELMIPKRINFHKQYDLTERVLPSEVDTSMPSEREYAQFLIQSYLRANGIGQLSEINYLLKNSKKLIANTAEEMCEEGVLSKVSFKDTLYIMEPASFALLTKPLAKNVLKILSPFDNLLIQRKRVQSLFDFDYQLECYVPKEKRKYGYFVLPVLWDGKLVARIDCKVESKERLLQVLTVALEPSLKKKDAFNTALNKELALFTTFNECERFVFA